MSVTTYDSPKAQNAGIFRYAPGTRLDWTITVPVEYDLSTVTAVFEVLVGNEVIFRASSTGDYLTISSQTLTVAIPPDADTEDELEADTFADAMTRRPQFNLDLSQTGSDVVDYRIQGEFEILAEWGNV